MICDPVWERLRLNRHGDVRNRVDSPRVPHCLKTRPRHIASAGVRSNVEHRRITDEARHGHRGGRRDAAD